MTLTAEQQMNADVEVQIALKERGEIPRHIACIMDGNGRWAKERGKNRAFGHKEGVESVRDITEACAEIGVEYLTLYTLSTENWQRPPAEVMALMELLVHAIRRETRTMMENGIRLRAIGDLDLLPDRCRRELDEAMSQTESNQRLTLTLALSYGGRWEIVKAAKQVAALAQAGVLDPATLDEAKFASFLQNPDTPDPDLLIRTGGDLRVSNFLLWQIAYTELYVTPCYWPAFRRLQLYDAVRDFQNRERRFGRVVQSGD